MPRLPGLAHANTSVSARNERYAAVIQITAPMPIPTPAVRIAGDNEASGTSSPTIAMQDPQAAAT